MAKKLKALLKYLPGQKVSLSKNPIITGISDDSREIKPGFLFVSIKGLTSDGHDYIDEAAKRGAVAIVGEKNLKNPKIVYVKVADSRKALASLASAWYDNPSKKIKIIGVTGTDGKTTTSNIIYHILNSTGFKAGLVSTVSAKIEDKEFDTGFHVTNPRPMALHKFLKLMVDGNCEYAVLETTSHGLDQDRVYGINYDISVLTNITNEHLDYHKTYDNYLKTKAKLFQASRVSILNKDDMSFSKISKLVDNFVTYSKHDLKRDIKKAVEQKFPEDYNQSNAAAAIAVVKKFGVSDKQIIEAVSTFKGVRGRMEEIDNNKGFRIFVDYAHTPNAVYEVLTSLRKTAKGKLISLVSAEGERDPKKRVEIPKTAVKISDFTLLNPIDTRSEDPRKILGEMEKGAEEAGGKKNKDYFSFLDRGEAIFFAINKLAKKGDTVALLGKGHETGMDYKTIELPWSDQEAAKLALKGKVMQLKK